jgi:hypothetical protein
VGRGHLIRLAALAAAATAAVALSAAAADARPAPAGAAAIRWTELARGPADLTQLISPVALVAYSRDSAIAFSSGLPQKGVDQLLGVNYGKNLVVGLFGPFGCRDQRVVVKSIVRKGSQLLLTLVTKPAAAGATRCRDKSPTYRLLVLPKNQFHRPYPTHADTRVAGA